MTRLGDVVEMTFGFAFKSSDFTSRDTDVRLLRGDNIVQGRLRWSGVKKFPIERSQEFARYQLAVGDVVVAMDRPWIEAGLKYSVIREADTPSLLVQRVARLRARDELDQGFLALLIGSRAFTEHVIGVQTGSAVPHISGKQIAEFSIGTLPPLEVQRGIAATLGALDDKIESNRRIIDLVPTLIRAFVEQHLHEEAREVRVAELARFVNGGAYTKGASGTGRMVIRIAELNSGPGGSTVYSHIDVPADKTARPGELLMSWSGSLGVYRWVLDEAIINQHIFKVLPSDDYPAWLVHDRLNQVMPVFQAIAKDKATTMGHIQRGHLESTMIEVSGRDAIRELDHAVAPLWDRLLIAEQECVRLAALRDTLLPELLSGRVRVPEAQDAVEEAVG